MHLSRTTLHSKVCACSCLFSKFELVYCFTCFCLRSLVEVRLHEPLWKVQFSPDDVAIEVLTLCSQLEPLCKKEYAVSNVFLLHVAIDQEFY